jgi:hypothetical protein
LAETNQRAPAQPQGENRSKQNQAKPSPTKKSKQNSWFYLVLFVRIRTFQWVTANPNMKNLPAINSYLRLYPIGSTLCARRGMKRRADSGKL